MKHSRCGGARTALQDEGVIVIGHYGRHAEIAAALGLPRPKIGEAISVRLAQPSDLEQGVAEIAGDRWRVGDDDPRSRRPFSRACQGGLRRRAEVVGEVAEEVDQRW